MIRAIANKNNGISFLAKSKDKTTVPDETRILPNTPKTHIDQGFQKTSSAFIDYPIKGLKGDINSNFYEFLAMGAIPYVVGSLMFMLVFNATKKLDAHSQKMSSFLGKKMALGVVFYALLKAISKPLITKPIKAATGVDVEMPYQNIVYNLPKEAGEDASIEVQHQQRKVFDSKEFFRKDLLDREYFDKVAKKLGLGENLNDSVSETTPIIQNIVATSNTAKTLSSYAWAAVGVGLAVQNCWSDFFTAFANRKHGAGIGGFAENLKNVTCSFVRTIGKSAKSLWKGDSWATGYMKHAGKGLIGLATLLTLGLTAN
ncbi:MAG: hypothetical protein MJ231_07930, partial [bacterium]|nr:hypothetical protein [bacterium]